MPKRLAISNPLALVCGLLSLAFLGVMLLWPLSTIISVSLQSGGALDQIVRPYYLMRLGITLLQATLSTLLCVLLALPCALFMGLYDVWGKQVVRALLLLPFVLPSVVVGMAFLVLVGPQGVLGIDLRNSLTIILLAHAFYNVGIVVRLLSSHVEHISARYVHAARGLGSPMHNVLWRIVLPLSLPAILSAAALVFVLCFTSFGIILLLAPQSGLSTLEVEIYRATKNFAFMLNRAALLVIIQLLVVSLITWWQLHWQRRSGVTLSGPTQRNLPRPQGVTAYVGYSALLGVMALVLLPIGVLVSQAWHIGGFPSFMRFWQESSSVTLLSGAHALRNSLMFASLSTTLALGIGSMFAYAVVRGGWRFLDGLSLLPLATSALTLGLGYLLSFPQLILTPWGIVLIHALIIFPFTVRSLIPAWQALPVSWTDAARGLGSSPYQVWWRIERPYLAPSFAVAWRLGFLVSMGELGVALVLSVPFWGTLPLTLYRHLSKPGSQHYSDALMLAFVLLLVTFIILLITQFIDFKKYSCNK